MIYYTFVYFFEKIGNAHGGLFTLCHFQAETFLGKSLGSSVELASAVLLGQFLLTDFVLLLQQFEGLFLILLDEHFDFLAYKCLTLNFFSFSFCWTLISCQMSSTIFTYHWISSLLYCTSS